jgi:serine/threonine protein kinase
VYGHFAGEANGLFLPDWFADPSILSPRSYAICMPLMEAALQSAIPADAGLSDLAALAIGIQVCSGLSHLHRYGIVHRDVKADNVVLRRFDNAMWPSVSREECIAQAQCGNVEAFVCDLGEALAVPQYAEGYEFRLPNRFKGAVMPGGAPFYIAPEVLANTVTPGPTSYVDFDKQVCIMSERPAYLTSRCPNHHPSFACGQRCTRASPLQCLAGRLGVRMAAVHHEDWYSGRFAWTLPYWST